MPKIPVADEVGRVPFRRETGKETIGLIYEYCNWLSNKQQIESSNWSYPIEFGPTNLSKVMVNSNVLGFRLPMFAEWQQANVGNLPLLALVNPDGPIVLNYAWSFENSRFSNGRVGNRLPNPSGLFDMFGNVEEVCHADRPANQGDAGFFAMGNSARAEISAFDNTPRGSKTDPVFLKILYADYAGYRIMRCVEKNN